MCDMNAQSTCMRGYTSACLAQPPPSPPSFHLSVLYFVRPFFLPAAAASVNPRTRCSGMGSLCPLSLLGGSQSGSSLLGTAAVNCQSGNLAPTLSVTIADSFCPGEIQWGFYSPVAKWKRERAIGLVIKRGPNSP